ncbi:glycosyltransferase family A protein [Paracoccus sp. DMF-8]|uniref:glycosyltransferase family 2 protein n=1 Tax=Paracoccus sp. DMF-8 TaxID=3019445 RepID=UPI0023E75C68|nr:glycosyltransferase family A protein [Paracoccus sp. DMF-8]MDF3606918.1 glycosyltransferase family A protein [Paracoccus sp. DMF-8]
MSGQVQSTAGATAPTRLPRLSIVILSRHRPQALALCLAALERQDHPDFELVLVADPAGLDLRPDLNIKRISFDRANVSAARNLGIAQAAGQVIAFIDDDALAPPNWARRLCAGFADPRVIAATGFTRGPDGLSWQAQGERIAPSGETFAIAVADRVGLGPRDGCPVSTIGTNCAFRRDALLAIGGFDPAFRYFLDESDVNMRMAARFPDALTAIIPDAEVIHGIAAGPQRAAQGVPRSLTDIGRSAVIFAQRYRASLPPLELEQRQRLCGICWGGG